jgi:hypothetical protein
MRQPILRAQVPARRHGRYSPSFIDKELQMALRDNASASS